jgi:hypothetical protein
MARSKIVGVERLILTVRRQRVILSSDRAEIYGVETRTLNQAVKRNEDRFPPDFAFRLTRDEAMRAERSRSHRVILKRGQNIKYLPLAFTEHGAIMAATGLPEIANNARGHPHEREAMNRDSLTVVPVRADRGAGRAAGGRGKPW